MVCEYDTFPWVTQRPLVDILNRGMLQSLVGLNTLYGM